MEETNNKLLKKDWQLLTAYSEITNTALLQSVLEFQGRILSKLEDKPLAEIVKEINASVNENYKKTLDNALNKIPDYPKE